MKKRKSKAGLPPGTVVYTGKKFDLPIKINYLEYTVDEIKNEVFDSSHQFKLYGSNESITQWYDLRGLHDVDLIQKIATTFGVHPLIAEDITDVHKRPEYNEYNNGHFISLKKFHYDQENKEIIPQSISIFFGPGFVLSFQENEDDVFEGIRERLVTIKGKIRQKKADYLFYALIDFIVDGYYLTIENLEDQLERIEQAINTDPEQVDKADLYNLKINLIKLRKSLTPLREALSQFARSESPLIEDRTNAYIRDVYDHTIQIVESIDSHRDILSGLQDLYISEISLKMNRIMQFLTIITAIFVPLSFLTGLYGMNFEYIPELGFRNGYFILWGVMLLITIASVIYFKKKKWF